MADVTAAPGGLSDASIGYGFVASRGQVPAYAAFPKDGALLRIVVVVDVYAARCECALADLPGVRT
jgi:hypothetical protein